MSIIPKLKCPPDYSILSFRYVECKKVGIVKGISKETDIDLKDFFIPVTEYTEKRITLKPGQVQRIDAGNLFNFGEQNESYSFKPSDLLDVANGTTHVIEIYSSEDGELLYTTSFTVVLSPSVTDFLTAFNNFYNSNTTLQSYVTFSNVDVPTQSFSLTAITAGVKQLYRFTFNSATISPFYHPGNLIVPYRKWNNGRLKIIFALALYANKYTLTNKKNFEWAFDDDYKKLINPKTQNTKINTNSDPASTTITWFDSFDVNGNLLSYNARPAYNLFLNDLIRTDTSNASSFISLIDGYTIELLADGIGTNVLNQLIQKVYSPNTFMWRTSGELLTLTGGEEVNLTDKLNIETIWIKNNQTFNIEFEIILAS